MLHIKNRMPTGVILLILLQALNAAAFLYFGLIRAQTGQGGGLFALAGLALAVTAAGVALRKPWGWMLTVIEVGVGMAAGIVGVTYAALSFPAGQGRGTLLLFIAIVMLAFAAAVALLVALARARLYFKESEQHWRAEEWKRLLTVSVLSVLVLQMLVAGNTLRRLPGSVSPPQSESELAQAILYCDSLAKGAQKDSCVTQIAVAAASRGETVPPDFCARVSAENRQLKFLCIAYARQIASCDAFDVMRERTLCRALVSGNVEECEALDEEEKETCAQTVEGYLDALQQEDAAQ